MGLSIKPTDNPMLRGVPQKPAHNKAVNGTNRQPCARRFAAATRMQQGYRLTKCPLHAQKPQQTAGKGAIG